MPIKAALTLTSFLVIPPQLIAAGSEITLPAPNGQQKAVPSGANGVRLTVNVALADKLAAGKTVDMKSFLSADGGATWDFINGTLWRSYGPDGFTVVYPDGTTIVNPDPTLFVPLNGRDGNLFRAVFANTLALTAGLTVESY